MYIKLLKMVKAFTVWNNAIGEIFQCSSIYRAINLAINMIFLTLIINEKTYFSHIDGIALLNEFKI